MAEILTIFTPTYNRADTLARTYKSLCEQTCKDFKWLVVDDGSTDATRMCVEGWINDGIIDIRYVYKENGGLFTGYNTALEHIDTELNVCIDSDDFMPPDAVEVILTAWRDVDDPGIAGLIGLDYDMDGVPIGGLFRHTGDVHFQHLHSKIGHYGDVKIVCRTELMKRFWPMPSFGEKNFNPVWFYLNIDEDHLWRLRNDNYCVVDYQPAGMSAGIYLQYVNSPKSFAELRRVMLRSRLIPLSRKFVVAAHYVSSSIMAKDWLFLKNSPRKVLTVLAVPAGILLNWWIKFKANK